MTGSVLKGRVTLFLIALVFLGPLGVAAWMYFGDRAWQPAGRSNFGRLLAPVVNLNEQARLDALSNGSTERRWALIYANREPCLDACRDALYRLRQSRLMLGKDRPRLVPVFLHGDSRPDKVFLDSEHKGLITIKNAGLSDLLDDSRPDDLSPGGLFLVDPLGNLVMYFAPDLEPKDMISDIEHLLELSRIG